MMIKRILTISFFILFSMVHQVSANDTDWTAHIKVSIPDLRMPDGAAWNHLIAGVNESASDLFESNWDTLSMIEVDDPIQAMFSHGSIPLDTNKDGELDSWSCSNPDTGYNSYHCSLWRDIRYPAAEKTWPLTVLSIVKGGTVTLSWSFENKPENTEIVLVDLSKPDIIIDMKNTSTYSYTNNFNAEKKYGIRNLEIRMKAKGLFIMPSMLSDATVGTLYSEKLSAVGGVPEWNLTDNEILPLMSIDRVSGKITGTPLETGTYEFTVNASDPISGLSGQKKYKININPIPQIKTLNLPEGITGDSYSSQIILKGGSGPFTWKVNGNLPEGLYIDNKTGILSGSLKIPGIYRFVITVTDVHGAASSKEYLIKVIEPEDKNPPAAIHIDGLYNTDTSVLLIWSAPVDYDSILRTAALYDLRYMEECPASVVLTEETWDNAIEAHGEPRPQHGAVQTYTLTGLKAGMPYCIAIRGMDATGNVSGLSNVVTLPLSSSDSLHAYAKVDGSVSLRKGYNLISMPLIPVPNGRDSLFAPSVGNPVALYRWYSAYPDITPSQYYLEDVLIPGLGYFLYSPEDQKVNVNGLEINKEEYTVRLQNGWNMVGTPFNGTVVLSDLIVRDITNGESKTYIESVKSDWIGNTIYSLEEGNYKYVSFNDDPPASLEPWIGYWIYVGREDGVDLIFRKP